MPNKRVVYSLPLHHESGLPSDNVLIGQIKSIKPLLLENETWYCQLRWIVISILCAFGISSHIPGIFPFFGFRTDLIWPFFLAIILAFANILFILHLRIVKIKANHGGLRFNLWTQIIFDLFIVTATIHLTGSVETSVAFLYLLHIVLACIFLTRIESLFVTSIASIFYAACLILETIGVLPSASVYENGVIRIAMKSMPIFPILNLCLVLVILFLVWFLASRLSSILRRREKDLMETNKRLLQTQKEKMQFMLQTTHELKAPFAAIQANTQLLLKGYCGELPLEARDIIQRINDRSHRLAGMIQEMLQLANLRSQSEGPLKKTDVDLVSALKIALEQVRQIAEELHIELKEEINPGTTFGVEEHIRILFINLLKNAIQYSRPGGVVKIWCGTHQGEKYSEVIIEDHGIGISGDKIPRIFDEYFRTNEALQHNKDSTGLGLAIVKHIADSHQIHITVESSQNEGTTFGLKFPFNPC